MAQKIAFTGKNPGKRVMTKEPQKSRLNAVLEFLDHNSYLFQISLIILAVFLAFLGLYLLNFTSEFSGDIVMGIAVAWAAYDTHNLFLLSIVPLALVESITIILTHNWALASPNAQAIKILIDVVPIMVWSIFVIICYRGLDLW